MGSNGSDVSPKVLKLSFEVSECAPLVVGPEGFGHVTPAGGVIGRGLHLSIFQLKLSRF